MKILKKTLKPKHTCVDKSVIVLSVPSTNGPSALYSPSSMHVKTTAYSQPPGLRP